MKDKLLKFLILLPVFIILGLLISLMATCLANPN